METNKRCLWSESHHCLIDTSDVFSTSGTPRREMCFLIAPVQDYVAYSKGVWHDAQKVGWLGDKVVLNSVIVLLFCAYHWEMDYLIGDCNRVHELRTKCCQKVFIISVSVCCQREESHLRLEPCNEIGQVWHKKCIRLAEDTLLHICNIEALARYLSPRRTWDESRGHHLCAEISNHSENLVKPRN